MTFTYTWGSALVSDFKWNPYCIKSRSAAKGGFCQGGNYKHPQITDLETTEENIYICCDIVMHPAFFMYNMTSMLKSYVSFSDTIVL